MNRREALSALVALPATARVSVVDVKSSDIIVIECEEYLSQDNIERIRSQVEIIWPGRKVMVLAGGMKIKVLSER